MGFKSVKSCSSSFLEACSTDEAQTEGPDSGGNNDEIGFVQDGNVYTIDLSNSNFSSLDSVGGWMNGYWRIVEKEGRKISRRDIIRA